MGLGSILGGGGGGGLLGGILGGGGGIGGLLGNLLQGPMSMLQGMMNPLNMLKSLLGGADANQPGGANKAGKGECCQKHDVINQNQDKTGDPNSFTAVAFTAQINGISNQLGGSLEQGFAAAIATRFNFS